MLPPRRSDRDDYSALKEPQQQASSTEREPTRPDEIRRPGWTGTGGMESEFDAARRLDKHNQQVQQQKFEERKAAEPTPEKAPQPEQQVENAPGNEQTIDKPESRQRETQDTAQPENQTEKKADEQEFDAQRFMTDPDYRREMKEQRVAEQRERTQHREQAAERNALTDRER